MNWGNKLLVVFIAFAGLMSYLVYRCTQVPVNLVTKEYYRDELKYQDVIDGTQKANRLSTRVSLVQDEKHIVIRFPPEMKRSPVSGTIIFYCAADAGKDRAVQLQLDSSAKQQLDIRTFIPGNYIVKLKWQSDRNDYYSEQPFLVR